VRLSGRLADGSNVAVVDLSEGGAQLADAGKLSQGGRGRLMLDGYSNALEFEVREVVDGHAHLKFEAANEPAWRDFVARHGK
jgi:hypothetical protein